MAVVKRYLGFCSIRLAAVVAVVALAGMSNPLAAQSSHEDFVLGVGDTLTVAVWKNPDLGSELQVRPDGKVALPLVGETVAAGRSPSELQIELTEKYSQFVTAPAVSVVVNQINSLKIYIVGEVGSSGEYDIVKPTKLMQALAMAGGLTEYAKKDQVVVLRVTNGTDQRRVVSIKDIISGKTPADNILLEPGDTIIVP